jgi:hypothetical protein
MMKALWDVTNQFQNKNGSNLVSGKIYIYYQGRTALATTYHDEEGTVVNTNPVLLDNNGRATVFADTAYSYTIVVCDYYGKELFSQDITLHDVTESADELTIIGSDGSILIDSSTVDSVKTFDLSANTDILATKQSVDDLDDRVTDIESTLPNKKNVQTALEFTGSATKTVKSITQNANGEMNVEFEDIDLPQEVPNVNVTSSDSSVEVTTTIDPDTNTKTFDLSVANDTAEVEYGRFIASNVTATATLIKTRGNIELSNNKIQLKGGSLYHFTIRGSYQATSLSNTLYNLSFIEYSTFNSIMVNIDNSIADNQYFEFSFDVVANNDIAYPVAFTMPSDAKVSSLEIDVHSVVAGTSSSSPSTESTMEMCESMTYLSCTVFNQFPYTVNGYYYTGAYQAIQTEADLKLIEGTSTITAYKEFNTFDHFQAAIYKWNPTNSNYELVAYTDRYDAPALSNGFIHLPITHVISDTLEAGQMYYVGLIVKSNTQVPLLGGTLPSMTWSNPVPQFTKSNSVYDDESNAIPASTLNTTYAGTDKTESVFVQIHSNGVSYHV